MEGKEAKKRARTGANSELLATNARDDVVIPDGSRRRTAVDTPSQAGQSAEGGASKGGKGKGKGKEKQSDELSGLIDTLAGFTVLGATGSALSELDPAPVHDPTNAEHNPAAPKAKPLKIHNAELGLRLETFANMTSKVYVNIAGPGAMVGEAVDIDDLNAITKQIHSVLPGKVNDLTKSIQRPLIGKQTICTCGKEWQTGMLGKNNSGAALLVYFPDNRLIPVIEKSIAELVLPDCSEGTRPMNVCFLDLFAHHQCKCMFDITTAIMNQDRISLILVAMCEPTQTKYVNEKESGLTQYTIRCNGAIAKVRTVMNLMKSTDGFLMEKLEHMQDLVRAQSDVIRKQKIENDSSNNAMFCVASATNNEQTFQKMIDTKCEFMRVLDTPEAGSAEDVAGSADLEADRNAPEPDEMLRLFLDLVKLMPEKQYEEMRTRVLSAPLVTKAIEEQVAAKVEHFKVEATEAAIEARAVENMKAKETEMQARFAESLKAKEAEMEAKVVEAVMANKLELVEKISDTFREKLVKSRDLFMEAAREIKDLKLEEEIVKEWNEGLKEFDIATKLALPTATATANDTTENGAAAATAAASTAATSTAAASTAEVENDKMDDSVGDAVDDADELSAMWASEY